MQMFLKIFNETNVHDLIIRISAFFSFSFP